MNQYMCNTKLPARRRVPVAGANSDYLFIYLLTLQPSEHNYASHKNKIQTYNRKN
jgi:hypothetical protein